MLLNTCISQEIYDNKRLNDLLFTTFQPKSLYNVIEFVKPSMWRLFKMYHNNQDFVYVSTFWQLALLEGDQFDYLAHL